MNPILEKLGVTPEMIARHVVKIEPALTAAQQREVLGQTAQIRARRLRFLAQGLTGEGLPRKRSANGTRKPYVRKKHTTASPYYRKRMEADSRLMGS